MSTLSTAKPPTYAEHKAWREQMAFFPPALQLADSDLPVESVWPWEGHEVHIERFESPSSPVNLILLHGVGSNGRQMSMLVGAPLHKRGIASVAIDLPGYGVTRVDPKSKLRYGDWVRCVCAFVDAEAKRDTRPIVLYGLSAGGMLAYQVAAVNDKVKGIVGMTFLDQRVKKVRLDTAHDEWMGRVGVPIGKLACNTGLGGLKLPMTVASKMHTLVNDKKALKVFLSDPTSGGNWVTSRFIVDYMTYAPAVEPEEFTTCPILLTQPADDRWTPLELSDLFLKRLKKAPYKVVLLENAGHLPLEQPGIDQMHDAIEAFIKTLVNGPDALQAAGFKVQG